MRTSRRPASAAALAVLLLLGLHPAPGGAQGGPSGARLEPVDELVVVDAGGQVVGPVLGTLMGLPVVLVRLRLGGRDVAVSVGPGRIRGLVSIKYESDDCSGPAYLDFELPPGLPPLFLEPAAVTSTGDVLVVSGSEVVRTIESEAPGLFGGSGCDDVPPSNESVRPVAVLGAVSGLAAPFRLRGGE
jgi:hypothetical protein